MKWTLHPTRHLKLAARLTHHPKWAIHRTNYPEWTSRHTCCHGLQITTTNTKNNMLLFVLFFDYSFIINDLFKLFKLLYCIVMFHLLHVNLKADL